MHTQLKLEFSVFGDEVNFEEMTRITGLQPSSFWRKGDMIRERNDLLRKESCWNYTIGFVPTLFIDDITNPFISTFAKHSSLLSQYLNEQSLNVKIFLIIEIANAQAPAMNLNREFLKLVNDLKAEIDCDLYVFSKEDVD